MGFGKADDFQMIIVEAIESKWPLSARVIARCIVPCSVKIGLHGFDILGADSWKVIEHSLCTGDKVRLKVRRPFPRVGDVVDTSTILSLHPVHE